jgi:hypothetical protein
MRQSLLILATAALLAAAPAFAADAEKKTVEQVFLQKDQLAGKPVQLSGKVVKVNNGIMRRNFLHLQDGSGKEGTNDLILTSTATAAVGDQISVTGVVTLNRDFGMGYSYPVLVEEAQITKTK